ncbi:SGNH/GDSL hydrolase family protein [Elusimicrobiota bacterium]
MSLIKKIFLGISGAIAAIVIFDVFAYLLYTNHPDPDHTDLSVKIIPKHTQAIYYTMKHFSYQGKVSDKYGYELVPNSTPYVNAFGTFDREYSVLKPADTYRILVVGDSVTNAHGIYPDKKRYTEIVAEKLNSMQGLDNIKYEVINAGFSGYDLGEYAAYMEAKAEKFQPDMVIIGITHTDTDIRSYIPLFIYNHEVLFYKSNSRGNSFFHNYICRYSLFWRLLLAFQIERNERIEYIERNERIGYFLDDDKNSETIKRIKRITESNNAILLAIIFPKIKKLTDCSNAEINHHRYILELIKNNNIDFLDLTGGLIEKGNDTIIEDLKIEPDDEHHFSEKGHKIIGDLLFNHLQDNYEFSNPDNDPFK